MQLERWLRENAVNPQGADKKKRARKILRYLPAAIIGIVILFAFSPIRLITSWSSLSPAERSASIGSMGLFLAVFLPIYVLLYFVMPGKRTGKTGFQQYLLRRKEDSLVEQLDQIGETAPRPPLFRDEDYRTAAEELRRFKPLNAEAVQAHANQPWFKILVLSGAVEAMDDRVIKLVSIKSIEEDREAGFDEE